MTITSNPGRIGLTQIHGALGVGIRLGQFLNRSGFQNYEHAFMDLGDGTLIQAEPGREGAQIRPLSIYAPGNVHWCDGLYAEIPSGIRANIALEARKLEHVKYSFLDYDALVLHRFGLDTAWLQSYIGATNHLICSQLVDLASARGGYNIFNDLRWPGFVTPGDLDLADMRVSGHQWDMSWRGYRLDRLGLSESSLW